FGGEWRGALAPTLFLALVFYIIFFTAGDYYYMRTWKSVRSLHTAALEYSPPNLEAVKFLADLEIADGNSRRAIALAEILRSARREWMRRTDVERCALKADYITAVAMYHLGESKKTFELLERIRHPYASLACNEIDKHAHADYKTILLLLGSCYDRSGRSDSAADCYEALSRLFKPAGRDAVYYRGVALMRRCRYAAAAKEFEKALRLNPDDLGAKLRLNFCAAEKDAGPALGKKRR
ncbi:MAG: tetratricopeptide repeat protein, partial [Victivallales bacterium]|nr:tetratricopeptide repeat protein [Victivallales bacterium]